MKNERSLYWTLILYEDSDTLNFKDKFEKIKNYEYLYIKHDKDIISTTGEIKKIHYHIVLKFKNYKWRSSLAEELEIESNYLQPVRNLNNILCYLIHYKEECKHHYDLVEVKGSASFKDKLNKVIKQIDMSEDERVSVIFNYIMTRTRYTSFSEMTSYIISKGLWADFRRSYGIFIRLLDEHNSKMV